MALSIEVFCGGPTSIKLEPEQITGPPPHMYQLPRRQAFSSQSEDKTSSTGRSTCPTISNHLPALVAGQVYEQIVIPVDHEG